MAKHWVQESPDRRRQVEIVDYGDHVHRREVVEDRVLARYEGLSRMTQVVWLGLGLLEGLIALRVILQLIAANPASAFAAWTYAVTDLFLWPFFGLTATPTLGNMVLDLPAIIAMVVYALAAWAIVKVIWLLFYRSPTRSVSTYDIDQGPL